MAERNWGNVKPPPGTRIDMEWVRNMGLVAGYFMQDGAGSKLQDLSGNKNHGTLVGGVTWTGGKFGSALSFDGSSGYVNVGYRASLDDIPIINYSVSGWIYNNGTNNNRTVISQWTSSGDGWFIRIQPSGTTQAIQHTVYFTTTNSNFTSANSAYQAWTHFTVVYNASTKSSLIYINGSLSSLQASTAGVGTYKNNNANILIGTLSDQYFPGLIDVVRIYNMALTQQQITDLYAQPFYMFPKRSFIKYFVPSGGPVGLSIPVAMQNYRQRRIA